MRKEIFMAYKLIIAASVSDGVASVHAIITGDPGKENAFRDGFLLNDDGNPKSELRATLKMGGCVSECYSCYSSDEEQVIITKEAEDIHGLLDCMVSGSAG